MKDLENFCKLFNINIPVPQHQEYYFDQLLKSGYQKNINQLLRAYALFEEGTTDPFKHKMATMDRIVNLIKSSRPYNAMLVDNTLYDHYVNYKIEGRNYVNKYATNHPETIYLSIDLSKANYQILKQYDDHDFFKDSWDSFLLANEVSHIYTLSKPFRQHVFGNLNPKRQQRLQSILMDKLSKYIDKDEDLIFKSHDELVYKIETPDFRFDEDIFEHLGQHGIIYTQTVYKLTTIAKEKFIKNTLDEYGDVIGEEFRNIEGHMFYMYLKKYITLEPYDNRDLMFINNNRLAKWVDTL